MVYTGLHMVTYTGISCLYNMLKDNQVYTYMYGCVAGLG